MTTPVNYYIGAKRGSTDSPGDITSGTSSAGSAVDVEIRMQIDNGSGVTGLTRLDTNEIGEMLLAYLNQGGQNGAGTNLPAF